MRQTQSPPTDRHPLAPSPTDAVGVALDAVDRFPCDTANPMSLAAPLAALLARLSWAVEFTAEKNPELSKALRIIRNGALA